MEDAYTVGIRIALEDGVSAGVTSISGDLAILQRTIAAAELGLVGLQTLASSSLQAASGDLRLPVRHVEKQDIPAADPVTETPTTAKVVAPPAPSDQVMTIRPVTPAVPAEAPASRAATAPVRVVVHEQTTTPTMADDLAKVFKPTQQAPSSAVAPKTLSFADFAPATPFIPPARLDMPELPMREFRQVEQAVTLQNVNTQIGTNQAISASPASTPSGPWMPAASAFAPSAGIHAQSAPISSRAGNLTTPPTTSLAAPHVDRDAFQGDVFLDGARMGRWIANKLAREAARPQGGSTFFDPRMGQPMPGTLQGG